MRRFWLVPLSLIALSGCEPLMVGAGLVAANEIINEQDPNFAAQNYAVADYLISQADTYIDRDDLILAEPLTDIQAPEISTTIAKLIPEQIGVRLSQLGYRLDLSRVATSGTTSYVRPALTENRKPDFLITGNYLRRTNHDIDIKARIIDLKTNSIVAVFDYSIYMTRGVRDLSTPKPKIIRTTPTQ